MEDNTQISPKVFAELKAKKNKDSDAGSSNASVNQLPAVPPVNADEETKDLEILLLDISRLEADLASLKQKLHSFVIEKGDSKQVIEEQGREFRPYPSEAKLEVEIREKQLRESKALARMISSKMKEIKVKTTRYETEIKSTREQKEKIWNGVTEQLKNDIMESGCGSDICKKEGLESSISGSESTDKLLSSPVKETEDPEVLAEKIYSLKQKLQSVTEENGELKQQIVENETAVRIYITDTEMDLTIMKEELHASKELAKKLEEHMRKALEEKVSIISKHASEIKEMVVKTTRYETEISDLKSTHEKKEKAWNGVTEQLKNGLKEKCELVDELTNKVNRKDDKLKVLCAERRSQDLLINQLKTELGGTSVI